MSNNIKKVELVQSEPEQLPIEWDMRPYEKLDRVGVLDPAGENFNPLSGQPYSPEYRANFLNNPRHWKNLPVNEPEAQKKSFEAIQNSQVILVKSGTGSGKSSQFPKFMSHLLGYKGKIAITIPTQVSATGAASYMAESFDVKLGEEVGYKFRGQNMSDKNGKKTRILFATDGAILAQMLGDDPDMLSLNAIVMDEVHKRSSNIDLLLLLIKNLIKRRPDFKLALVSATINTKLFMDYFPAPEFKFTALEISSKPLKPITQVWAERPLKTIGDEAIQRAIETVMKILTQTESGDILVFLTSNAEIAKGCKLLESQNKDNLSFCLTASGGIFRSGQDVKNKVIKQDETTDKRKVIMSTDVAEESITIENIDFVVDSGLSYQSSYDPKKMANILKKSFVTKSSVKQRMGRTGRIREGTVYHLYTEKQFNDFPEFDEPEIKKIDLSNEIISITNMPLVQNYKKTIEFMNNLIEPPSHDAIASALRKLEALGCFSKGGDGKNRFQNLKDLGDLTILGKAMAKFPVEPAVARSLLIANHYFVRVEATFMYAIMEVLGGKIQDLYAPFGSPMDRKKALEPFLHKRGDYFTALNIYHAFESFKKNHTPEETRRWCDQHYVSMRALSDVKQAYFRLIRVIKEVVAPDNVVDKELEEAIKKTITTEYKTRERKLVHVIEEGEGLVRYAKKIKGDQYKTEFPPDKTVANLGRDTMIPSDGKLKDNIIYNSLLILEGRPMYGPVLFV